MARHPSSNHLDVFSIQQHWEKAFPVDYPKGIALPSVVWTTVLSENGDTRRSAEIRLKALRKGKHRYVWRIPWPTETMKPFHVSVSARGGQLPFTLETADEGRGSVTVLTVDLGEMSRGEELQFQIGYVQKGYAGVATRRGYATDWSYRWAYRVHCPTGRFEKRVIFPKNSRILAGRDRCTHPEKPHICMIDGAPAYVLAVDNPSSGVKGGRIIYRFTSPAFLPTVGIVASLLAGSAWKLVADPSTEWPAIPLLTVILIVSVVYWLWSRFVGYHRG